MKLHSQAMILYLPLHLPCLDRSVPEKTPRGNVSTQETQDTCRPSVKTCEVGIQLYPEYLLSDETFGGVPMLDSVRVVQAEIQYCVNTIRAPDFIEACEI